MSWGLGSLREAGWLEKPAKMICFCEESRRLVWHFRLVAVNILSLAQWVTVRFGRIAGQFHSFSWGDSWDEGQQTDLCGEAQAGFHHIPQQKRVFEIQHILWIYGYICIYICTVWSGITSEWILARNVMVPTNKSSIFQQQACTAPSNASPWNPNGALEPWNPGTCWGKNHSFNGFAWR